MNPFDTLTDKVIYTYQDEKKLHVAVLTVFIAIEKGMSFSDDKGNEYKISRPHKEKILMYLN